MSVPRDQSPECPVHDGIDRRKTAQLAARSIVPREGAAPVQKAGLARAIMRSQEALQSIGGGVGVRYKNPDHAPVIFLDGMPHRKKRMAIAKFLSPNAVTTQHRDVMVRMTEELIGKLRGKGEARLEDLSFQLAAAVVSEIIGLTNSDRDARAKRVERALYAGIAPRKPGLAGQMQALHMTYATLMFMWMDVMPAKKARMAERKNDVISTLLDENYVDQAILIECLTYGSAGMATTREFIVMAAWYLFEQPELRARFLASDMQGQLAVLMEILRLEPVAGMLHRLMKQGAPAPDGARAGELYAIDIRAVNTDEELVGACPFAVDPDRAARQKENGRYMSFGDGAHNCPGWQVALHETRIFLDALFRVPGLSLKRPPDIDWNPGVQGYELSNAIITCDRVGA